MTERCSCWITSENRDGWVFPPKSSHSKIGFSIINMYTYIYTYKPSILGYKYPDFWKHPYIQQKTCPLLPCPWNPHCALSSAPSASSSSSSKTLMAQLSACPDSMTIFLASKKDPQTNQIHLNFRIFKIPLLFWSVDCFEGHRKGSTTLRCPRFDPTPTLQRKTLPRRTDELSSFLFSSSSSPPKASGTRKWCIKPWLTISWKSMDERIGPHHK